jgi:hypothetical protein
MSRRQLISSAFVLLAAAVACLAQSSNDPNRQVGISDKNSEFDRLMSKPEERNKGGSRRSLLDKESAEFISAIPRFRQATEDLRVAVGTQGALKESVRNLDKLIKPFTDYLKGIKLKPSPVDPADFQNYSREELEWETLTTAERIDNNLQRAKFLVIDSDETGTVSITTIQLLADIHSDLTRLKWLNGKLASSRTATR